MARKRGKRVPPGSAGPSPLPGPEPASLAAPQTSPPSIIPSIRPAPRDDEVQARKSDVKDQQSEEFFDFPSTAPVPDAPAAGTARVPEAPPQTAPPAEAANLDIPIPDDPPDASQPTKPVATPPATTPPETQAVEKTPPQPKSVLAEALDAALAAAVAAPLRDSEQVQTRTEDEPVSAGILPGAKAEEQKLAGKDAGPSSAEELRSTGAPKQQDAEFAPARPLPPLQAPEIKVEKLQDDQDPSIPAAPVARVEPPAKARPNKPERPSLPPEAGVPARQAAELQSKKTAQPAQPLQPPLAPPSEDEIVKELPEIQTAEPEHIKEPEEIRTPPAPRPSIPPMFIIQITPELDPIAKVGGLADVVYGLSRELEIRGNSVEIIMPKYDCMRYDHIWGLSKAFENLWVPWSGGGISCTVWFGFVHGRKCYFIEPHSRENFFNRNCIYGQNDDVARFAFFCRAALEFMLKSGKHPDIIHCHDWQTALVPVLLFEMYKFLGMTHPRVCFTIHNFRHQTVTGDFVLRATGLNRPEYFFHYDRMRDNHNPHAINLMKGGIVFSNFVTTVSPRHAWESKDAGQGHGLEPTLHTHHYKYGGVLNGLDYEMYNPEADPYIPAHYNAATIEKKYDNKRALRQRFWLADNVKPIIAFIGRLDPQKGLDLVRHAIFYALGQSAQFVLLGSSPDRSINDHFWGLKRHLNDSPDCHLEIGFHNELAHLIYAGADMMIVPSRFEPCGLTQLISMRYGTVPIVRSVGGLADTVFDKDHANRPLHERNGYVFHQADNRGVESAIHRAIRCYYDFPQDFRALMLNGMKADYSWNEPGQHYLNIYDYIRQK